MTLGLQTACPLFWIPAAVVLVHSSQLPHCLVWQPVASHPPEPGNFLEKFLAIRTVLSLAWGTGKQVLLKVQGGREGSGNGGGQALANHRKATSHRFTGSLSSRGLSAPWVG